MTAYKKVAVIGGGIAGMTAAWELSQQGFETVLIEKGGYLGGHAVKFTCKASDKCLECGACAVEKTLKEVTEDPNIKVFLFADVDKIEKGGRFKISVKNSNADKPNKEYSINKPKNFTDVSKTGKEDIEADAVVLATGFNPFDPKKKPTYNYGDVPNIITGMELEEIKRMNGKLIRPSDGKEPKKIGFIQCVGSRDNRLGNLWCSHVCCPYALRMAQSIKYKNPDVDITVFYMDIQNTGKDFNEFYEKAKADFNFVRNIPIDIYPNKNDTLRTRYLKEDGVPCDDIFDMIVLSVGIMPGGDNQKMADILKLELDHNGFVKQSSSKGIFIAGTVGGPKTIAASIAHAGQAASEVIKYLKEAK